MNLKIDSIHFKADSKLIKYIEKKSSKIDKYYDKVIDLDVKLKLESNGQVRDKIVEFLLKVPGEKIFTSSVEKTFEAATDLGLDSLKRQLKKYKEKQRKR